jgi:hypothetical protein
VRHASQAQAAQHDARQDAAHIFFFLRNQNQLKKSVGESEEMKERRE